MDMKKFLWIDLEMTGLDETEHVILEVAAVVTDLEWTPLEEYHRIVFQPPEKLALMDDWCVKHHGDSGLTAAVPTGTPLDVVEKELLEIVERHFGLNGKKENKPVLAGNSIDNDRRFIVKYMPRFTQQLHYRLMDVSSFKEVFKNKFKIEYKKENKHRAIDDIHESIAELKHYLSFVQVPPSQTPSTP